MEDTRYKDPDIQETGQDGSSQTQLPSYAGKILYTCETLRYLPFERGQAWKIGMGLIVLLFLAIALFTQAWFMAAAIVVFVWVYTKTHNNEFDPLHATLTFSEVGLLYQGQFYPYRELESYYFVLDPDVTSFQFRPKGKGNSLEVIYLFEPQNIQEIRTILKGKVQEQDTPDSDILHRLFRMLKL